MRYLPQAQPALKVQEGKAKVKFIETITEGNQKERRLRRVEGARLFAALHKRSELLEKAKELGIEPVIKKTTRTLTYYQYLDEAATGTTSMKKLVAVSVAVVAAAVSVIHLSVPQRACLTVRLSCDRGCSEKFTESQPTIIFASILSKDTTLASPITVPDQQKPVELNAQTDNQCEDACEDDDIPANEAEPRQKKEYQSAHMTAFNMCKSIWKQSPGKDCDHPIVVGCQPSPSSSRSSSSSSSSSTSSTVAEGDMVTHSRSNSSKTSKRSRSKKIPTRLHQPGNFNVTVKVAGFKQRRTKEPPDATPGKLPGAAQRLKAAVLPKQPSLDLFEAINDDPVPSGAGFDILIKTAIMSGRTTPMLGLLTMFQDVTGANISAYPLFKDAPAVDRAISGNQIRGLTATASTGIATFSSISTTNISISSPQRVYSPIRNGTGFSFPWACVHESDKDTSTGDITKSFRGKKYSVAVTECRKQVSATENGSDLQLGMTCGSTYNEYKSTDVASHPVVVSVGKRRFESHGFGF